MGDHLHVNYTRGIVDKRKYVSKMKSKHSTKKIYIIGMILLVFVTIYFALNYFVANPFQFVLTTVTIPINHHSINNPSGNVNYKKVPKAIQNKYLHIDTYSLKPKSKIYFDSLLERYAYFYKGDTNFVTSYVGSHGFVNQYDPIVPADNRHFYKYNQYVALSPNYRYSDLSYNPHRINDYANAMRIANLANEKLQSEIFKKNDANSYQGLIVKDSSLSQDEGIAYFSSNCAPRESYCLTDFDNGKYSNTNQGFSNLYFNSELSDDISANDTLIFMNMSIVRDDYLEYHKEQNRFLNGKLARVPKAPYDVTRGYPNAEVNYFDYYNHYFNRKRVYSNGNAYFLQYMLKNYHDLKVDKQGVAHTDNYHVIDLYHKGLHLNPIMFNEFVRNFNNSQYQFNQFTRNNTKPISQNMINKIEATNYNLPCNYDDNHYYYRMLEGTLVRDTDIQYVNNHVTPLIMGDVHKNRLWIGKLKDQSIMPKHKWQKAYYQNDLEYKYAKKYHNNPDDASQYLNYERADNAHEPLWMTGLINNNKIGTYHPGEILRFNDRLSRKKISNYYIIENGKQFYIPTYKVNGYDCFKAICTFKDKTKYFVRAQDAYLLKGQHVKHIN